MTGVIVAGLIIAAVILAAIELARSGGASLSAWAVLLLAVAFALARFG